MIWALLAAYLTEAGKAARHNVAFFDVTQLLAADLCGGGAGGLDG